MLVGFRRLICSFVVLERLGQRGAVALSWVIAGSMSNKIEIFLLGRTDCARSKAYTQYSSIDDLIWYASTMHAPCTAKLRMSVLALSDIYCPIILIYATRSGQSTSIPSLLRVTATAFS